MQIGVIGLGRMGGNIVRRLTRAGHSCVVYDADPAPGAALAKDGATAVPSVPAMVEALQAPRTVWVLRPAGKIPDAPSTNPGDMEFYSTDIKLRTTENDMVRDGPSRLLLEEAEI